MVKDVYTANLKNTSFGQKLSDKLLGTNYNHFNDLNNNYELQKAVNINKYNWNQQGMKAAGINPLIASGNLSNLVSSQAQSSQSGDPGYFGNQFLQLVDMLNPVQQMKETKDFIKDVLKKAVK